MAFVSTNATIGAIVKETTSGTPIAPSAGTDAVSLQDGFAINNEVALLENAELSSSIDSAKPATGIETPTATISHYLRMSGVEGTAPNYDALIESAMGVDAVANGTEYATTTGSTAGDSSTRGIVKLASGGSDLPRGSAILLKDGTNGYVVRNVYSQATNDLTLAFNLANAPASGVNVGKCIKYSTANDGLPLSIWNYLGNSGGIQMLSGAKCNNMSIDIPAGEAINASFDFTGIQYYFNPIEVGADNDIDFTDSTGAVTGTVTGSTIYRDPAELASAVAAAMTAASAGSAGDTITGSYDSATGKFTFTSDGTVFTVAWTTVGHIGATLGFTADDSGALTYTSDDAQDWSFPFAVSTDSENFLVAKNSQVQVGNFSDYVCFDSSNVTVSYGKTNSDILSICAESAKSDTVFTAREITIDINGYMQQHDIKKWLNFKNNETIQFSFNGGRKSAGNWIAGSLINLYAPTATITSLSHEDNGGVVAVNMSLRAFRDGSNGAFYINML